MTSESRNLIRGLDARERAVLVAIYEHKVLLTEHVKAMFFGSLRRAQDRLRHLAQRGLIDTWYPPQPRGMGKASGHHTLTESGAQVVASLLGIARSELRYVVRNEEDREQDSYLAHRLGVNEFFCALIGAGRQNDGHGLAKWCRSERFGPETAGYAPTGTGSTCTRTERSTSISSTTAGPRRQDSSRTSSRATSGSAGLDRAGRGALSLRPDCDSESQTGARCGGGVRLCNRALQALGQARGPAILRRY